MQACILKVPIISFKDTDEITEVITNAIKSALQNAKYKAPSKDGIVTDILKNAKEFYKRLVKLFIQYI